MHHILRIQLWSLRGFSMLLFSSLFSLDLFQSVYIVVCFPFDPCAGRRFCRTFTELRDGRIKSIRCLKDGRRRFHIGIFGHDLGRYCRAWVGYRRASFDGSRRILGGQTTASRLWRIASTTSRTVRSEPVLPFSVGNHAIRHCRRHGVGSTRRM